jgi:hypothetical protein
MNRKKQRKKRILKLEKEIITERNKKREREGERERKRKLYDKNEE